MGNSQITSRLKTSIGTGVLNVSNEKLTQVPEGVHDAKEHIRCIDLSHNRIKIITPLFQLTNLKALYLQNNRIEILHGEWTGFIKLETLSLANNRIKKIDNVKFPFALKHLDLSNNKIKSIPSDFFDNCLNLEVLKLGQNFITDIPKGISNTTIVELHLSNNKLRILPEDIYQCGTLRILHVEHNMLAITSISTNLLKHSNIVSISANGNLFKISEMESHPDYEYYLQRVGAAKRKMY
ncbi:hypothetical protein GJ496_011171 [Pomphorhynchus laevis]|nr:hypothetical protein GJ496_011171 [Pomphorhynchus laevis]